MQQFNDLLELLPVFQGTEDYIVHGNQHAVQILDQLLNAHIKYEQDYDKLAPSFAGGNVPRKLFDFCKGKLPYNSEPGRRQTTRSPAGILTLADITGVDCKHYSSYIAGILDALNRTGNYNFDWYYRFAFYGDVDEKKPLPDHVYIVIKKPDGSELWLDPAPVYDPDYKEQFERFYNDREILPIKIYDRKPETMSIIDISGPRRSRMGCLSNCGDRVGLFDTTNLGLTTDSGAGTTNSLLTAAVPGAAEAQGLADSIANLLPDGGFKDFLKTFLKDPVGSIKTLLVGRTYTSGAYALGEIYMRNILGYSQIQDRQHVPDSVIVQAETFWTTALGVLIGSNDHLDQLVISPQAYINWSTDFQQFSLDQVTRAHNILKAIGYPTADRNSTYPLKVFASIPYIYPIPTYCLKNCTPVTMFTGVHPITNISLVSGYPAGTPGATGSSTGAGNSASHGMPPSQAGMGTVGTILVVGMAATLLFGALGKKKHKS